MSEVKTRMLTVADAEQFVALRRLALKTDPAAFPWDPAEDPSSNLEVVRKRLSTAKPADGPFVVGAFAGDLIGTVGLIRSADNAVRLWGVYVRPEWRRRGVGRRLMGEILELAFKLPNTTEVVLSVARSEGAAIRLYKAAGCSISEEVEETVKMVLESTGVDFDI